jgi:hypothetical protein
MFRANGTSGTREPRGTATADRTRHARRTGPGTSAGPDLGAGGRGAGAGGQGAGAGARGQGQLGETARYKERVSTTVIVSPPGVTVSWSSREIRLDEVTVIVAVAPDASDPEAGETLRPAAAEIE